MVDVTNRGSAKVVYRLAMVCVDGGLGVQWFVDQWVVVLLLMVDQ